MVFVSVLLGNQEFGCRHEVIEYILLFVQHSATVPILAKLIAAAQLHVSINSAMLQKHQHGIAVEDRGARQIESAITGEHGWIPAVERQPFLIDQEHGHASAIFRFEPELLDLKLCGINIRFDPLPLGRLALQADAECRRWISE